VSHLAHYFGHVGCERIVVPIDPRIVTEARAWMTSPVAPPGFDRIVVDRVEGLRDVVKLRPWPSNLEPPAVATDMILDWDVARTGKEPWARLRSKYRHNRTLFEIDWRGTRLGAAWLAEAAMVLTKGRPFDQSIASGLKVLSDRLGTAERAFLFGTGPSAREALNHDLSDGIRIACNTVVLDQELMDHIRPDILTFADPIFHFGPSSYAQRFQHEVVRQAERHNFAIVTTERFAPLFQAHVPEVAARVIGLRQGTSTWVDNFELLREPAVKPYPNVLTMLMLPLAASFATSIALIGFDGRSPGESYFWRHGSTVQFKDELDEIKQVHPGFFNIDYDDYYSTHVAQLEGIIRGLEARGLEVRSLTRSHMNPLRRRYDLPNKVVAQHRPTSGPRLVSLTPDWIDDFGHFGPFERRLHQSASEAGLDHIAVASAALEPSGDWQIPFFTDPATNKGGGQFSEEMRTALQAADLSPGSVVFFYAGDVWHIPPVLDTAREHPAVKFVVNLMKSHSWIDSALREDNPWARSQADLLKICLSAARGTNVHVTVDTAALATDVEVLVGETVEVWPMVAVAPPGGDSPSPRATGSAVHIVSPVHAHHDKGFADVAFLSRLLKGKIERGELAISVRHAPQPMPITKGIAALADDLVESGVNLIRQNMSDGEYADLIASADIVLIPYRIRPFRTRTSGVVLDALMAGKPVVTVRGTWAGDLVERYGAGVTYNDGDVREMRTALEQVVTRLSLYHERMPSVQKEVTSEFAPDRLVSFLANQAGMSTEPPSSRSVEEAVGWAERMRDLFQWRTQTQESHLIDLAVFHDDRRRTNEAFKDQIEILNKSIEWHQRASNQEPASSPDLAQLVYPRAAGARLDETALVASLIDPKGVVSGRLVDVGAHHGSSLSHFLAKGWGIVAFEPDARHYEHLVGRYESDERVHLDPRAVASTSGEMRPFYTSGESTGVSALAPFLDSHVMAGSVETVALRDVLDDLHVNVLKVDTEGFDLAVLEGFPWDRDLPDVVICEFEDRKTKPLGYTTSDLADFLVERGYQVWMSEWHPVVRYGIQHEWHRLALYPCEPSTSEAWGNFVAFRHPRSERTLASALAACLRVDNPDQQPDSGQTPQTLQPGGDKADRREAKVPPEHGRALAKRKPPLGRRQELRMSLKGQLGPVLGAASFLASLTVGLAIVGEEGWALAAGAAGIAATVLGIVVVAARVERRTR